MDGVKSLRMKGFLGKHLKESRTCNMTKNPLKRAHISARERERERWFLAALVKHGFFHFI
jgi:hypothetical protein